MLTDTHCHLDFNKFDKDRDTVIQRALDVGVERMMIPALDYESSLAGIKLAESHPNIYAAVGFHPTDLEKWDESSIKKLRTLILDSGSLLPKQRERAPALQNKILAIGEIGLDYYWVKEADQQAVQRDILKQQLKLAQDVNKPVIIHMREENDAWFGQASIDLLAILTEWHQELRAPRSSAQR